MGWICPECDATQVVGLREIAGGPPSCPACLHGRLYRRLPLFLVLGASGVGKTTMARHLAALDAAPDAVYLDSDILLIEGISDRGWDEYRDVWVWLCVNISQSGRPVVLFGGGDPADYARASRAHCFSSMHCLALTCDADELRRRLHARPAWRESSEPRFMAAQIEWNERLMVGGCQGGQTWHVVDTSASDPAATAREVAHWVAGHWPVPRGGGV